MITKSDGEYVYTVMANPEYKIFVNCISCKRKMNWCKAKQTSMGVLNAKCIDCRKKEND